MTRSAKAQTQTAVDETVDCNCNGSGNANTNGNGQPDAAGSTDLIEQAEALGNTLRMARTTVKRSVPVAFTASETFNVGVDLGSPVSLNYFDRVPLQFDGKIGRMQVELKSLRRAKTV